MHHFAPQALTHDSTLAPGGTTRPEDMQLVKQAILQSQVSRTGWQESIRQRCCYLKKPSRGLGFRGNGKSSRKQGLKRRQSRTLSRHHPSITHPAALDHPAMD